jgi:asparagine synthase (glutamine-hydrolysing)
MCGICGILSAPEQLGDREKKIVEEMKNRLRHRGPDGDGLHVTRHGILGHQRLAIIDLDHGAQPMLSPDRRYALIFNGEIYNYLELRQTLIQRGQHFQTFSDTEVLLHMLIHYRKDALTKLNGMFAFVFLDTHTGEWLMARDHFGIKPLYFMELANGQLLFASEIKAILAHPDVHPEVNLKGLNHYFTFQFCLNGETLFKHIKKIEPGHFVHGQGGVIHGTSRYWDACFRVDEHHTEQYFVGRLRSLLEDSAKLQVRSDVPLGAYLSGGIDSSVVTCMAASCLEEGMPVFTGKFLESAAYDESSYARLVAGHAKALIHEVVLSADDFVEFLPKIMHAMDEPLAGPGVFPQYMVSRLAVQHVKVVLGGQGGDEIFGGYARYLVGYLEQALKGAIYETQEEGSHLVGLDSIIPNLPLLRQYGPLMKNFWRDGLFDEMDARYFRLIDRSPDISSLLTEEMLSKLGRQEVFADFQVLFNHPETKSYINKMTHFDFKTLLPALLHVEDRVSMAVSLESRVPILDPRIVELVGSAPPAMKFKGGKTKALLKSAVRNIIPDQVLDRKDKMGFPVPLAEWMQGGVVRDFVNDTLLGEASRTRGIYSETALRSMADNQGVGSRQLWGALSLELWHQRFIDAH